MTREDLTQEHSMVDKIMSVGKAQSHADLSEQYAKQQCMLFLRFALEQNIIAGDYDGKAGFLYNDETYETAYNKFLTETSI